MNWKYNVRVVWGSCEYGKTLGSILQTKNWLKSLTFIDDAENVIARAQYHQEQNNTKQAAFDQWDTRNNQIRS